MPASNSLWGGTMYGFRRMSWVGRQHSADHPPVSALQLVTRRRFKDVGCAISALPRIVPNGDGDRPTRQLVLKKHEGRLSFSCRCNIGERLFC